MSNFEVMFLCLVAGQFIRRRAKFRIQDVRPLNIVVLWVSLPALILSELPKLYRDSSLTKELAVAVAMPWAHFLFVLLVILLIGQWLKWSRGVIGALVLTAGLGNTSFVGIPVIDTVFGSRGVQIAVLIDQLGTFLIVATAGLFAASYFAGKTLSARAVIKRVLFFPPFLAFVLATIWGFSSIPIDGTYSGIFSEACRRIGATLSPLALLSVGWQLELTTSVFKRYWKPLSIGLAIKLVIWPCLVLLGLAALGSVRTLAGQVTLLEAAMAPMITSAVVASEFDLEPELAQAMVGVGLLVAAITLFVWATLLWSLTGDVSI